MGYYVRLEVAFMERCITRAKSPRHLLFLLEGGLARDPPSVPMTISITQVTLAFNVLSGKANTW
jgi:hypothetical protein